MNTTRQDGRSVTAVSCQVISVALFLVAVFFKDLTAAAVFWLSAAVWRSA